MYGRTSEITDQVSDKATSNKLDAGPSEPKKAFDPVSVIRRHINSPKIEIKDQSESSLSEITSDSQANINAKWMKIEEETEKRKKENIKIEESCSNTSLSKEDLERRLNIEKEVTFVSILPEFLGN